MKKSFFYKIGLAILVIILDQITKRFFLGSNHTIIPFLIGTREAGLNTGGAWGIFSDNLTGLIIFSIAVLIGIIVWECYFKSNSKLYNIAIAFIFGGAVGNLIDRIFCKGVRDFIYFIFWQSFPTFNLADSFLCIGVFLLIIYILFFYADGANKKKSNKTE